MLSTLVSRILLRHELLTVCVCVVCCHFNPDSYCKYSEGSEIFMSLKRNQGV